MVWINQLEATRRSKWAAFFTAAFTDSKADLKNSLAAPMSGQNAITMNARINSFCNNLFSLFRGLSPTPTPLSNGRRSEWIPQPFWKLSSRANMISSESQRLTLNHINAETNNTSISSSFTNWSEWMTQGVGFWNTAVSFFPLHIRFTVLWHHSKQRICESGG